MTESSSSSPPTPPPARRPSENRFGNTASRPPVLASEALKEDVAPLHPWSSPLRHWEFALGILMLACGALLHFGVVQGPPGASRIAFAVGGVVLAALAVPFPYVARGALVFLSGASAVTLGLLGRGPLAAIALPNSEMHWEVARVLVATILPAALLFRASYRAYGGARVALIVALLLSLPACLHQGMVAVTSEALIAQLTAALSVLAVLTALFGFMGSGTTAASTVWAVVVLLATGVDVLARAAWAGSDWTSQAIHLETGLAFLVACALTALGLFQLLASALARDARRVDVLRMERNSIPSPPVSRD